ncbi:hypothetical protein ACJX0J_008595 [Zea mays]
MTCLIILTSQYMLFGLGWFFCEISNLFEILNPQLTCFSGYNHSPTLLGFWILKNGEWKTHTIANFWCCCLHVIFDNKSNTEILVLKLLVANKLDFSRLYLSAGLRQQDLKWTHHLSGIHTKSMEGVPLVKYDNDEGISKPSICHMFNYSSHVTTQMKFSPFGWMEQALIIQDYARNLATTCPLC